MTNPKVLPGFSLSMGITLTLLSLVVFFPMSVLVIKASGISMDQAIEVITDTRTLLAIGLTIWTAFVASLINLFFGLIVAWVQTQYNYPFRKVVDALIDLPFALPTSVAGIALTAALNPVSGVGAWLKESFGIQLVFNSAGIVIAMIFIGLPFIVRTIQPVLKEIEREVKEASYSLGASSWQTFRRVLFPMIFPAMITGFGMAFARVLGEYGSVIFIAGNMPMKTEIVSLLIVTKLEQFDTVGAAVIAVMMLGISFLLLLSLNMLQLFYRKRLKETV